MESSLLNRSTGEGERLSDFLSRIFVMTFMLAYAGLVVALVAWNIRNSLAGLDKKEIFRCFFERFRHLRFPHRPRNAH